MLINIVASIAITLAVIMTTGLSGLGFYLWPTGVNDQTLSITPDVVERLRHLQVERKFGPDPVTFYPGTSNESERIAAQAAVDATIASLIAELPARPQRSTVLTIMKRTLANVDNMESEERDRVLVYLTRAMEICGVRGSGELFNVWRYGFPYGWIF